MSIEYITAHDKNSLTLAYQSRTDGLLPVLREDLRQKIVNDGGVMLGSGVCIDWAIQTAQGMGDKPLVVAGMFTGLPAGLGGDSMRRFIAECIATRSIPDPGKYGMRLLWGNQQWFAKLGLAEEARHRWKTGSFNHGLSGDLVYSGNWG